MTEIIRKPRRRYPLPDDVRELDNPWPSIISARHARVHPFKEGYDSSSSEDPTIVSAPTSPSTILSEL